MWNWLKKVKSEPPPRKLTLNRIAATVTLDDDSQHTWVFKAKYLGVHPLSYGEDWIMDAQEYFDAWRERFTKLGSVYLSDGKYMPVHRIKEINTSEDTFEVEVP